MKHVNTWGKIVFLMIEAIIPPMTIPQLVILTDDLDMWKIPILTTLNKNEIEYQ